MTRGGAFYYGNDEKRRIGMRSRAYREQQLETFRRNPMGVRILFPALRIRRMMYIDLLGWVARGYLRAHIRGAYARRHTRITKRGWAVLDGTGAMYNGKVWHSIMFAKVDLEIAELYAAHTFMTPEL